MVENGIPSDIAIDGAGTVYIADGHRIHRISETGDRLDREEFISLNNDIEFDPEGNLHAVVSDYYVW